MRIWRGKKEPKALRISAWANLCVRYSALRAQWILKYLLARQFNELERLTAGLDGKEGSVILTERNTVALNVLAKELKAGRKNLAIFYGAAHMPDIEKRMVEKMGFEREGTRWLNAWDLPPRRK